MILGLRKRYIERRSEKERQRRMRPNVGVNGLDGRGQWVAYFLKSCFHRKRGGGRARVDNEKTTLSLSSSRCIFLSFSFVNFSLLKAQISFGDTYATILTHRKRIKDTHIDHMVKHDPRPTRKSTTSGHATHAKFATILSYRRRPWFLFF